MNAYIDNFNSSAALLIFSLAVSQDPPKELSTRALWDSMNKFGASF